MRGQYRGYRGEKGVDANSEVETEQGERMDAYERLISDAIRGDGTLFAREDAVEAAWQIVDPALQPSSPVQLYEAGSWGPPQADAIVASVEGWRAPLPV